MLAHMLAHTHTHTTHTCLHTIAHGQNTITLVHKTEETISFTHTYSSDLALSLQYLLVKRISLLVAMSCSEARIFVAWFERMPITSGKRQPNIDL